MQLPEEPSVLVLLVATDGEPWLPEVLRGLRAQQYAQLQIIAVDNASTDATPAILKKAFGVRRVVTLTERAGYGAAVTEALARAAEHELDADAVLLLHDDAALEPGAVEAMVDVLRADEVGIVGAKLREWDDPQVLQDIGGSTDRYGRIIARVERGEIDQGQHDGVREVLYATSAVMMIGREVIDRVGLFDPRYEMLRDDLDLCWRARLTGIRTVVTTDAVARHASATVRDLRGTRRRVRYQGDRNLIATLIKNYSTLRLLGVLPITIAISVVNVILYAARGRRAAAVQVLEALRWNVTHLASTVRERRRVQEARTEPDRVVVRLMHRGAARIRAQIERAVETVIGEVEEVTDEDLEAPPPRILDRVRAHPVGVTLFLVAIVALLGARPLLVSGPLAGVDMPPFPSNATPFFQEYASGWRGPMGGGAGPASPGFVVLGLLTFLCFGSGWLAQRLVLFGLPVVGAIGMLRLAKALGLGRPGRWLAAALFTASPLMLGAFGAGRLPDLTLTAAAPFLALPLVRSAGLAPDAGWRSRAAGVLGLALTASLSPWALVFALGLAVVLGVATGRGRDVLRTAAWMAGGAFVLLLPWSLDLLRDGSPLGAGGPGPATDILGLLTLSPGSVRPVPVVLGLGITLSAFGILLAPRERRAGLAPLAILAVAAIAIAWAVSRGVPWIAPRAHLPLIGAALALPILAGEGAMRTVRVLAPRTFGGTHLVAGIVGLLLATQLIATAGWIAFGSRPGLVRSGSLALASLIQEADEAGDFRVVWLGGSGDDPAVFLTGPDGASMRGFLTRRTGEGEIVLRRIVASMLERSTDAAGRLLATLGVRYVIVRPEADAALRQAVAAQPDLAFAQRLRPEGEGDEGPPGEPLATGTLIYRNASGIPVAAPVRSAGWSIAAEGPLATVLTAEPRANAQAGLSEVLPGVYRGPVGGEGQTLLLAEDFSGSWRMRVGDTMIEPERSFGWATRFVVAPSGEAQIWFAGQRWHRAGVLLQALLLAAFLIWRSQRVAREKGLR